MFDVARGYRPNERRRIEGDSLNAFEYSIYKIERTYNTDQIDQTNRNDDDIPCRDVPCIGYTSAAR